MSMPLDLVTLGITMRWHLENHVIGMMLIGDAQDREAAYKWLSGTDFTGRFREQLFATMQDLDARGEELVWPTLWSDACVRSGCPVKAADFSELSDSVASTAPLPLFARKLRDISLEHEAAALHRQALEEGDSDGSLAQRLTAIAGLRSELRKARCNG